MDSIYLNHAGTSWPKPSVVMDAVATAMIAPPGNWPESFERAHHSICRYFGVPRSEQLLLTPGCTSAISIALSDFDWQPNDRVLTSSWEHHALSRPLQKLRAAGVGVDVVPPGSAGPFDFDFFEESLDTGNVKLVAVTAACNVTGQLLPIDRIIDLAHKSQALVCLDAAQVVGWLPLNFSALGADMVAFGGHKGLQAPWGIGGLYLADHVPMKCVAASCGVPLAGDKQLRRPRPGYCDVGSVDQFSLGGLGAAVCWLQEEAQAGRLERGRESVRRFRASLSHFSEVTIFGDNDLEQQLPTVAFTVSGVSSTTIAEQLRSLGVIAASGVQCAPLAHQTLKMETSGVVRISFGIGQCDSEIEKGIEVVQSFLNFLLIEKRMS